MDLIDIKNLIIKLDVAIDAEHNKINGYGLHLLFDFTEAERKRLILKALEELNKLKLKELGQEKNKLYSELLFTRLQHIHKRAEGYREEKERFGIEDMSLDGAWKVLGLVKNDCCGYEEMIALQEGIDIVPNDRLLRDIEHDLNIKVTRTVDEIFDDIHKVEKAISEFKGRRR